MSNIEEIVELFTKILESVTFAIEELEFNQHQVGRGIFIIDYIGNNEPCNLKDIYENTKFPPSTASRRVDELVKAGFIERARSEEDRREIILQLTEDGLTVFRIFRDHRIKSLKQFLKSFDSNEVENFTRILRHLVDNHEDIFVI
ncbi:MAG: MarR family winged helix-turn-helix transcriptional regulator [Candidatus Thorarchaeota archaeon]